MSCPMRATRGTCWGPCGSQFFRTPQLARSAVDIAGLPAASSSESDVLPSPKLPAVKGALVHAVFVGAVKPLLSFSHEDLAPCEMISSRCSWLPSGGGLTVARALREQRTDLYAPSHDLKRSRPRHLALGSACQVLMESPL